MMIFIASVVTYASRFIKKKTNSTASFIVYKMIALYDTIRCSSTFRTFYWYSMMTKPSFPNLDMRCVFKQKKK